MKNELVLNYKCNKCNKDLKVYPSSIISEEWLEPNSKDTYTLTFIKCDECKNRIMVQVDNGKTLYLLKEIRKHLLNKLQLEGAPLEQGMDSIQSSMEELKGMRYSLDKHLIGKTLVHPYRMYIKYEGLSPQIAD